VLEDIILQHPECFSKEDVKEDYEQLTLTLALFHEMTKGKKSYWYPYLR